MASRRRSRATHPVRPSLIRKRTLPIVDGCGVLEAHNTSSSLSIRYNRQESHAMNSTTSDTIPCSTSCRLISRTMKRLIFWNRRSCSSVRSSRCSISLILDTALIITNGSGGGGRWLEAPGASLRLKKQLHRYLNYARIIGRGNGAELRQAKHRFISRGVFEIDVIKCIEKLAAQLHSQRLANGNFLE